MTRGEAINRAASVASDLVLLDRRIADVAKEARRTPRKTMKVEIEKVAAAKTLLPQLGLRRKLLVWRINMLHPMSGWIPELLAPWCDMYILVGCE